MACKIGLTIFTIVEAVALALFIIGTPLSMFRDKDGSYDDSPCLTMWGYKTKCSDTGYDIKVNEMFENSKCESRKNFFHASEGLSIVTIVAFAGCILMAILMCCCSCVACICRIVLMILIVVGIATGAATFACMAHVYNTSADEEEERMIVQKLVTDERVYATNDVAVKKYSKVGSLISDTPSDNIHLTGGSSPSFDDETLPASYNICVELKDVSKYGAGFILIIIGWALHTVNIVFALLPC